MMPAVSPKGSTRLSLPFAKRQEMKIFPDRKIIYICRTASAPADAFFADLLKNEANILAPR